MPASIAQSEPFVVAFDCETDALFSHFPGWPRSEAVSKGMNFTVICASVLPVSCLDMPCAEAMKRVRHFEYWRDGATRSRRFSPIEDLLCLFDRATAIVSYNGLGFDFPLIRRFYDFRSEWKRHGPGQRVSAAEERYVSHRAKSLDIMAQLLGATARYYKLQSLLCENGMLQKSGSGVDAVRLWDEGKREELVAYCRRDTDLTLELALKETLLVDGVAVAPNLHRVAPFAAALASVGFVAAPHATSAGNPRKRSLGEARDAFAVPRAVKVQRA